MADINGKDIRRVDLVSGVVQNITFDDCPVFVVSVANMTEYANVAYKVNDDITSIDDTDSNYMDGEIIQAVTIAKDYDINKISFISDADATIQWEIKR